MVICLCFYFDMGFSFLILWMFRFGVLVIEIFDLLKSILLLIGLNWFNEGLLRLILVIMLVLVIVMCIVVVMLMEFFSM